MPGEKMQMAAVDAVASLPLRALLSSSLLKLMLCQQARTSYDAAYLLLLLLPLPPLLPLKFSMPLLSNNLLAIFCHRRVFYFPHSFLSFFFGWRLKVRAGQNEHVADKGGEAQSRISYVVCSALPACSRECNASCLPPMLPCSRSALRP